MRNLNDRQRIVLGVGLFLLVVNCLFPPYRGEWFHSGKVIKKCYVGYGLVLSPPDGEDVAAIVDTSHVTVCSAHIITSQWFIQGGVIILITLGAVAIAATKEHSGESGR